jgi:hypothetical protein
VQVRLAELVEVQCGVAAKRQAALNEVFGKSLELIPSSCTHGDRANARFLLMNSL